MNVRDNFLLAIKSNHCQAVKRLINEINLTEEIENKKTPIQLAADLNHWECVKTIAINKKTDTYDKARYGYALLNAIKEGKIDTVRTLIKAGASHVAFDNNGEGSLHVAIRRRDIPMIELLLSYNFDLITENKDKRTPIQLTVDLGFWDCVETIAKNKKAEVDDKARYGDALIQAVNQGQLNAATALLQAGASRNWTFNNNGDACLHTAVRKQHKEIVALLLSFGFSLSYENKEKQTPEQLGISLHVSTLYDGWKIYFNKEMLKIANLLTLFVQAQRQPTSKLHPLPSSIFELILPFVSREVVKKQDMIFSKQNELVKISANCFIKNYPKNGFFNIHSGASTQLVKDLKHALSTSHNMTSDVSKAVSTYLTHTDNVTTNTKTLLDKYKLTSIAKR